ncbi:MAG: signal peptide peptidase SppA [Flavobacteriales bacterium]|nr:signal peptide peptidase SppA [Flavobacteriales bacterium]
MSFLKAMLASLVGTFLALLLIFLLFIVIIAAAGNENVEVKANSILHIKLDEPIAEREASGNLNFDPIMGTSENKLGLNLFIDNLRRAQTDDNIKGIFLEVGNIAGAPSSLLDVRNSLNDFKNSGKWIVAFGEYYSQGAYFVASAADEVYMFPEGAFDWRGLNAEVMFYKKMLDKLEIEMQVIRGKNNKFKSAVEPFIYDQMSPENKEQIATFIGDIWKVMLEKIADSRQVTTQDLNTWADSLSFMDNQQLLNARLLDGLKYKDEVMDLLENKMGIQDSTAGASTDLHFISLANYSTSNDEARDNDNLGVSKGRVAVVYAVGDINSGEGNDDMIGSDRIAAALRKARTDEKVKAIVLRVNSPGGSALASDVIWRETQLIKQSGKPFVVSMGDYAASGGYYIACAADKIFANPNTITGSIGVFGLMPNMQKFLDNKIGITTDRYETNPHADILSLAKPLDAIEMSAMQGMVDDIYNDFINHVAQGRNMNVAEVDSIGQGRVWSGEDAKNLGLVDELGDLEDAIKAAATMAGLSEYATKELPILQDPLQEMIKAITGDKEASILGKVGEELGIPIEKLTEVRKMRGVQARMPFIMEIK